MTIFALDHVFYKIMILWLTREEGAQEAQEQFST